MRSIEDRNALVQNHLDLAKGLAKRRFVTVNRTVTFDELLSAAYSGLIDAAQRFDEKKVNEQAKRPFRCYARQRIAGEMNDYLRLCNWAPRNEDNPKKMGSLESCYSVGNSNGNESEPLRDRLAAFEPSPLDDLNNDELFDKIVKSLPKREKTIFKLRFLYGMTMKEVAGAVNVSESRVSQILSDWTKFLRGVWESRAEELWDEVKLST